MTRRSETRMVGAVMAGHFIAAFSALGMPPFFALILTESLRSESTYLAGWFYVVPTLFTAVSSPWWGRLADRFGKRTLLLRAQLGLAISFLLAGYAQTPSEFFAALALQGLLGGTFGASNAYLATLARGETLARYLTLMQGSARAALIVAPVTLGIIIDVSSPIETYRYLALLPLLAAVLVWSLPERIEPPLPRHPRPKEDKQSDLLSHLYVLQMTFVMSTVVTFPYFVPYVVGSYDGVSTALAALLFGAPHVTFLLLAAPMSTRLRDRPMMSLLWSCGGLGVTLAGQVYAVGPWSMGLWRLGMGAFMTIGLIAINRLVASAVCPERAGRTFGAMESGAKWGAVAAGIFAGISAEYAGMGAPFVLGAGLSAVAVAHIAFLLLRVQQLGTQMSRRQP